MSLMSTFAAASFQWCRRCYGISLARRSCWMTASWTLKPTPTIPWNTRRTAKQKAASGGKHGKGKDDAEDGTLVPAFDDKAAMATLQRGMDGAFDAFGRELSGVRPGMASPSLLDHVMVKVCLCLWIIVVCWVLNVMMAVVKMQCDVMRCVGCDNCF